MSKNNNDDDDRATVELPGAPSDLSPEQRERIAAAVRIRNLTAIKALAAEFSGEPATAAIGETIERLAKGFDFAGLKKMIEDDEA